MKNLQLTQTSISMDLTISKKAFLRALGRTHPVADRKSSMPILSNILLTTESDGALRLSATDLYLGVTALAKAEVKQPGTVAVAARKTTPAERAAILRARGIRYMVLSEMPEWATQLTEEDPGVVPAFFSGRLVVLEIRPS